MRMSIARPARASFRRSGSSIFAFPIRAIRQQVSRALDLVVQIERFSDGSRKLTSITEVQRMESDVITLQELFKFQIDEVTRDGTIVGGLRATGLRPAFLEKCEKRLRRLLGEFRFGPAKEGLAKLGLLDG